MRGKLNFFRILLLILSMVPQVSFANISVGISAGFSQGTFYRSEAESFSATTTSCFAGYKFDFFDIHAIFVHSDIGYNHNAIDYQGIYSSFGFGTNLTLIKARNGELILYTDLLLLTNYTSVSEASGKINEEEYIHSELNINSGFGGFQAGVSYNFLVIGRPNSKSEKSFLGLFVAGNYQKFTNQKTIIKTNNSVLSPVSPGERSVDYDFSIMTLGLSFQYDL